MNNVFYQDIETLFNHIEITKSANGNLKLLLKNKTCYMFGRWYFDIEFDFKKIGDLPVAVVDLLHKRKRCVIRLFMQEDILKLQLREELYMELYELNEKMDVNYNWVTCIIQHHIEQHLLEITPLQRIQQEKPLETKK